MVVLSKIIVVKVFLTRLWVLHDHASSKTANFYNSCSKGIWRMQYEIANVYLPVKPETPSIYHKILKIKGVFIQVRK